MKFSKTKKWRKNSQNTDLIVRKCDAKIPQKKSSGKNSRGDYLADILVRYLFYVSRVTK